MIKLLTWLLAIGLLVWHPIGFIILLIMAVHVFYKPTASERDENQKSIDDILHKIRTMNTQEK